jgi:formylglycine-generating enzyme required for sulfatase activity
MNRSFLWLIVLCAGFALAPPAAAVTIPTVPIGNPGNPDDSTGFGAVDRAYSMGMTEITNAQYVEFLNAVAKEDTYGLYNPSMGVGRGGILRDSRDPDNAMYRIRPPHIGLEIPGEPSSDYAYHDKPVVFVSWYDALRMANWLHNGKPSGAQDANTTEDGAYTFSGATSVGPRNPGAQWFLPSADEWYKAAYYDGSTYYDYPTGTDSAPNNKLPTSDTGNSANFYAGDYTTGDDDYPFTAAGAYASSASSYGTYDQGGNVWEWNEALIQDPERGLRGGSWLNDVSALNAAMYTDTAASHETDGIGFRLATILVPEPPSSLLAILACCAVTGFRGRRRLYGCSRWSATHSRCGTAAIGATFSRICMSRNH